MPIDTSFLIDWITRTPPEEAAKRRAAEQKGFKSGAVGEAQKALGERRRRLEDEERKAIEGGQDESKRPGYREGGYTGDVPKSEPAGTVHGQEYVIPADVVSYLGTRFFDKLVANAKAQMGGDVDPLQAFAASLEE